MVLTRGRNARRQAPGLSLGASCGGFTLIELLIVLSLIIIIAAIAIPNWQRSRVTANEGAAIAALRSIASAQAQFQSEGIIKYPSGMGRYASLQQLGGTSPPLIDSVLATGIRQGYSFVTSPGGSDGAPTFTANADPVIMNSSGRRGFYVDESAVIRFYSGGPAGAIDLPVQ